MKNKIQTQNGDRYVKWAILKAHDLVEDKKISTKFERLEKAEDRFNAFLEIWLVLFSVISVVCAIAALVLSLVFMPPVMQTALSNTNAVLGILLFISYIVLAGLVGLGIVIMLYFSVSAIGTEIILLRGKRLDKMLIIWASNNSSFVFERMKQNRKDRSSYGEWQSSEFSINEESFYDAARKEFVTVCSDIQKTTPQAEIEEIFQRRLSEVKGKGITSLIITCYIEHFKLNLTGLKDRLFQ